MKKLIIIIGILTFNFTLYTLNSFSQPNGGFENWSSVYNIQEPDNWQTSNVLSLTSPPNPLSAFKATGIDKHSGNYALMLKTVFFNNNLNPQIFPDSAGFIFTGKITNNPIIIKKGYPFTGRPQKLEFWAKYQPVGNDVAQLGIAL